MSDIPAPTQARANYAKVQVHGAAPDIAPQPPRILVDPAVTGTPAVGQTLTCTTGTWTGSPSGYAYQWFASGVVIAGATAATRVVAAGDAGKTLVCMVTATNAAGTGQSPSNGVAIP
jgi:hypothetical protein